MRSVKYKAMAILLRSFIETALGDGFIMNNYHNALFRWHVLGETGISDPGRPPYYSLEFFSALKLALQYGPQVTNLATKQWYKFLMENNMSKDLLHNQKCSGDMLDVRQSSQWWIGTGVGLISA